MKIQTTKCMATSILIAAALPILLAAQDGSKLSSAPRHRQYTVQVLPGLGGLGGAFSINDVGWAAGISEPPGDAYDRAFLWRGEEATDLGSLGGNNSTVAFPNKNNSGWLVGESETSDADPYQENFCGFICSSSTGCLPFNQFCRGFLWRSETNEMVALPPLPGGNNSAGYGLNNQGQMVGAAENGVQDPTCVAPQVFDFVGVVWSLDRDGVPFISQQLPPIAGDAVSAAVGIDQHGNAIGASGPCVPSVGPGIGAHAVLWQSGQAIDLGNLGGTMNNIATAINQRGQVVGFSDLPGDSVAHGFLWERGVMKDIGTLRPDDTLTVPEYINDRDEVVGFSCGPSETMSCHGFHWQAGVMIDLNSVLPANSPLLIVNAADINSRGEIAIQAYDSNVGDYVAAVLMPTGNAAGATDGVAEIRDVERKITLPENTRKMLRDRMHLGHF
jgi:probable HAF family extracellular repeat protein